MGLMHIFACTKTPSYIKSECKFPGFLGFLRGWSKSSHVANSSILAGFSAGSAGIWGNLVQVSVPERSGKLMSSGQGVSTALVWCVLYPPYPALCCYTLLHIPSNEMCNWNRNFVSCWPLAKTYLHSTQYNRSSPDWVPQALPSYK